MLLEAFDSLFKQLFRLIKTVLPPFIYNWLICVVVLITISANNIQTSEIGGVLSSIQKGVFGSLMIPIAMLFGHFSGFYSFIHYSLLNRVFLVTSIPLIVLLFYLGSKMDNRKIQSLLLTLGFFIWTLAGSLGLIFAT